MNVLFRHTVITSPGNGGVSYRWRNSWPHLCPHVIRETKRANEGDDGCQDNSMRKLWATSVKLRSWDSAFPPPHYS